MTSPRERREALEAKYTEHLSRLIVRVCELEKVLERLADAGADGHSEAGCIFCLTGPNPEEPKYTLEMALVGAHLPTCWIGNALAKRTADSVSEGHGEFTMNVCDECRDKCPSCATEKKAMRGRIAELEEMLGTLAYEAHCVVKANSTLSMAGRSIKPSHKKLADAEVRASDMLERSQEEKL